MHTESAIKRLVQICENAKNRQGIWSFCRELETFASQTPLFGLQLYNTNQ